MIETIEQTQKALLITSICLILASCHTRHRKVDHGADVLKFRGSWFLRVYEQDWSDTLQPGKKVLVKGNEVFQDMSGKVLQLLKESKLKAYDDDGNPISYNQVLLNMASQSMRGALDTSKGISESDLFNPSFLGIELNDSIYLNIKTEKKQYFMHSINLFIPAEFNPAGVHTSVCKILYKDLMGKGFQKELQALNNRDFARKEKIYYQDGSISEEYTFYLTDAAGVEYYFRLPLEKVLQDDYMIEHSILSYFKDDVVDLTP